MTSKPPKLSHFALQGHSFGGFEVNYIVTHSHLFAAAAEAAGVSNDISGYLMTSHGGQNRFWLYELSQMRMGVTIWQKPQWYIADSPVFSADQITTPLLLLHNPDDQQVAFGESLQLFSACRRLHKPAWLLSYLGEGHAIENEANRRDYTARLTEFFDHYLKGYPLPDWLSASNF